MTDEEIKQARQRAKENLESFNGSVTVVLYQLAEAEAENAKLRAALNMVEWMPDTEGPLACPWCEEYYRHGDGAASAASANSTKVVADDRRKTPPLSATEKPHPYLYTPLPCPIGKKPHRAPTDDQRETPPARPAREWSHDTSSTPVAMLRLRLCTFCVTNVDG